MRKRLAPAACSLTVVLLVVALLAYHRSYEVWPWSGNPHQLHACGRDYGHTPGSAGSGDQSRAALEQALGKPLVQIGEFAPPLHRARAILATHVPIAQSGCGLGVYLAGGGDTLIPYGLEGGP